MASKPQVEYIEGLMAQRGLQRADLAAVHSSWGKYETVGTSTVSRILAWLKGEDDPITGEQSSISRAHGMMVMGRLLDERDALRSEVDLLKQMTAERDENDDDIRRAAVALRAALVLVCQWIASLNAGDQIDGFLRLAADDENSREIVNFFVRQAQGDQ